jgi:hypothetical protein
MASFAAGNPFDDHVLKPSNGASPRAAASAASLSNSAMKAFDPFLSPQKPSRGVVDTGTPAFDPFAGGDENAFPNSPRPRGFDLAEMLKSPLGGAKKNNSNVPKINFELVADGSPDSRGSAPENDDDDDAGADSTLADVPPPGAAAPTSPVDAAPVTCSAEPPAATPSPDAAAFAPPSPLPAARRRAIERATLSPAARSAAKRAQAGGFSKHAKERAGAAGADALHADGAISHDERDALKVRLRTTTTSSRKHPTRTTHHTRHAALLAASTGDAEHQDRSPRRRGVVALPSSAFPQPVQRL